MSLNYPFELFWLTHEESLGLLVTDKVPAKTLIRLDAQADLSLRWAHNYFVGFVVLRLKANDFITP